MCGKRGGLKKYYFFSKKLFNEFEEQKEEKTIKVQVKIN